MSELPFTPLERIVECAVPREEAGSTLLDYLCRRFDYLKAPQWQEQIDLGNLELDGKTAAGTQALRGGERLFFQARDLPEQEVSWDIQIVCRTPDYLVIDKPANLPCHPAGRFFNHTLWAWLKQRLGMASIHFVNRLDRETSGIVLVACNPTFAGLAAKYLHAHGDEARKTYRVMVHGRVPLRPFCADGWIGLDPTAAVAKKRRFIAVCDDGASDDVQLPDDMDAQPCRTDFTPLGYYGPPTAEGKFVPDADGPFTLLEARQHTVRIHQIRATLCSLGWPVVGDKLYGLDERIFLKFAGSTLEEEDWRRLVLRHQALHAMRLKIPALGIDASCPTPWL